jgi:hypothetical protein
MKSTVKHQIQNDSIFFTIMAAQKSDLYNFSDFFPYISGTK